MLAPFPASIYTDITLKYPEDMNVIVIHRQTCNTSRTSVDDKTVDHAAPTTSSLSTEYLVSMDWAKTTERRDEKHLGFEIFLRLILEVLRTFARPNLRAGLAHFYS